MRKRPLTGSFCRAFSRSAGFFSTMVVISISRSSGVDHESMLIWMTALDPVAMLLMLMAKAEMSSFSFCARAEAGANANPAAARAATIKCVLLTMSSQWPGSRAVRRPL
jgi:hypothetical protein